MRPRNFHTTLFIRALILFATMFVIWRFGVIVDTLRAFSLAAAAPLWRAEGVVAEKSNAPAGLFSSKKYLSEENRVLREENAVLYARLSFEAFVLEENRELKEILGRRKPKENALLAAVLSRPGRSPYDTLVIDEGNTAGIRAGNIVAAHGSTTIGVIERVHERASVVRLFSSSGEKMDALLGTEDTPIQAEGVGGGNFRATAPKDIVVALGDQIMINSADAPLLGIVGEVRTVPSSSFQEILFQTPVNIYTLKWVEVLLETSYPPIDGREELRNEE